MKEVPPQNAAGSSLTRVEISVDVLAILNIEEVNNHISVQFELKLSWTDERLTLFDLKTDHVLNILPLEARNEIWVPQVEFYNTQTKQESLDDPKAFATIERRGSFRLSPRQTLHNAHIFKGSENPISLVRPYVSKFLCAFRFQSYPFDRQACSAQFTMKGNSGKFVKLVIDDMTYSGPIDLMQYFILETKASEVILASNVSAVQFDIVFGRRLLSTLMTIYLPTFLLCLVAFATSYFKRFFFEAIVTVNLTSLLVLTTLFISVSTSLSQTSYIKAVDVWLLFSLFIPFSEALLQTMLENLNDQIDLEIEEKDLTEKAPRGDDCFNQEQSDRDSGSGRRSHTSMADRESVMSRLSPALARKFAFVRFLINRGLPLAFVVFVCLYILFGLLFYQRVIDI